MHPKLRFWLILSLGILAGLTMAFEIADGAYGLAGVIGLGVVWLCVDWASAARPEAWAVMVALVGYILANRGFAQLSLTSRLPLLPAELALLIGLVGTSVRLVFRQVSGVRRDGLNLAILAWILIGGARLWPDFRANGAMAVRDFATVYYALFFFIAQAFASHAPSARLLRKGLVVACAILPVSYFLFTRFEDVALQQVVFRGAPLVYYKDDLVAAYLVAGMFVFLAMTTWPRWMQLTWAGVAYASMFTINSSRAAIVGLLVTGGWWALARRWTPWKLQAVAIPMGIAALGVLAVIQQRQLRDTRVYALYEHVGSMVDFTGRGRYSSEDRRYVGDNNRFRLAWWKSVAEETLDQGPIFGVGFGYDLTERFIRTYEIDLGEDFNTRSPHSIVFTVFGRMGLVGLAALLAIVAAMVARTWPTVRQVRTGGSLTRLGWWSVAWVMFTSACFGVVLEGPMGAVVFWTALGLANGMADGDEGPNTAAEPAPHAT